MSLLGNVTARLGALAAVLAATLLLARDGGPAAVGVYVLLHVLPGLIGTVVSCGLVVAIPYFLAGPSSEDRRLPLTVVAIAAGSGAIGALLWAAAAPLLEATILPGLPTWLVALAGAAVLTRLLVTSAKACSQGSDDLPGANRVIVTEELLFLPAYGALSLADARPGVAIVVALLLADVATASLGWARLARRGFLTGAGRPSARLARQLAGYGARAQVGGLISQLNLRLDFVILGALTSPSVLGVYAIASKFAELLRVVTMAITYVMYPAFARDARQHAVARARRLLPRAGLLTAAGAVVLGAAAALVIPAVYGSAFDDAIGPARIIAAGLALEGVAAVVTAFLFGVGRPGLNSCAMTVGLAVTVALDLILIPRFGAPGAAAASACAYAATSLALVWMFSRVAGSAAGGAFRPGTLSRVEAR